MTSLRCLLIGADLSYKFYELIGKKKLPWQKFSVFAMVNLPWQLFKKKSQNILKI
jgi:hypothetical protein